MQQRDEARSACADTRVLIRATRRLSLIFFFDAIDLLY